MANELIEVLMDLAGDLPGFVSAAVVLVEDGLSIAEYTIEEQKVRSGEASAYLASIVKSNRKAIKLLEGRHVTNDILITTDKNYFLIRHHAEKPFFIFIMTSHKGWLGKARILIKQYEEKINEIMHQKLSEQIME